MIRFSKPLQSSWFGIGTLGIFLVSLALRFWGLSRFNTLVFDEVYYARFAGHFLKHELLFGGHPPLSTYIIAIGIWLGERLPFFGDAALKNGLSGLYVSTWSYRWVDALTGALIPLVVIAIAYQLSRRRSYALLAGLFAAVDGLFLVESRYSLNNVFLVIFGLLGQWLLLLALNRRGRARWLYLALAGVFFGASVAIKWNGLWFLFGAYLLWIAAWGLKISWFIRRKVTAPSREPLNGSTPHTVSEEALFESRSPTIPNATPLNHLTQLNPAHILLNFAVIPFLVYRISWIPYMQLDPNTSFWQWQEKILDYHHRVGGMDVHPYCSPWYTWMWMVRPVAYFYKTAHAATESAPVVGPPLPQPAAAIVYDVHAMGNPVLWWLSTAAMLLLISVLVQRGWQWLTEPQPQVALSRSFPGLTPYVWISLYLVTNWVAHLLPWVRVTRCTFIYHYMGTSIFAFLASALLVDRWLHTPDRKQRAVGITVIFLVLLAFVFWLPVYLGLPITPEALKWRMWFRSWV